jgi:hypothetical protein
VTLKKAIATIVALSICFYIINNVIYNRLKARKERGREEE